MASSADLMFPHVVAPLPGEWLPGLLLRCDLVNEWASGTTARLIADGATATRFSHVSQFILPTVLRLDQLATSLGVWVVRVYQTTYRKELRQFAGTQQPQINQFGQPVPFGICPACIAEQSILLRTLALPYLTTCLVHGLQIQRTCTCGAALAPFHEATPFCCDGCGMSWSELPHLPGTTEEVRRDHFLGELYDLIWRKGSPTFAMCMCRLMEDAAMQRGHQSHRMFNGTMQAMDNVNPYGVSIARLVLIFGSLGLPVAWIERATQPPVPEELHCRNEICPQYERRLAGNIRLADERPGSPIWFCTECGSRFTAYALLSTTDVPEPKERPPWEYPAPETIMAEVRQLQRWQSQLEEQCAWHLRQFTSPLQFATMLSKARIPTSEWLLAPRLGLGEIVQRYQHQQVERRCTAFAEELKQDHQQQRRSRRSSPFQFASFMEEAQIGMVNDPPFQSQEDPAWPDEFNPEIYQMDQADLEAEQEQLYQFFQDSRTKRRRKKPADADAVNGQE
jgi:hypothetical protein